MITKECFIVFQNTQKGPYPVMVELSQDRAYQFISEVTEGRPVQQNEWSIFKTNIHLPSSNRVIPGQLDVVIPGHILD